MSHRLEQIAAAIERGVREVLGRGFHDPRISGMITVTSVKVMQDLSKATINVSVMPGDREELTLHGLQSAAAFIRREVGELVSARQLPAFEFKIDRSIKKEAAILRDLDRARADLAARGATEVPVAEGEEPTKTGEGAAT